MRLDTTRAVPVAWSRVKHLAQTFIDNGVGFDALRALNRLLSRMATRTDEPTQAEWREIQFALADAASAHQWLDLWWSTDVAPKLVDRRALRQVATDIAALATRVAAFDLARGHNRHARSQGTQLSPSKKPARRTPV